jgi:hypothetical protein
MVLLPLTDEAGDAYLRAHRKLEEDEWERERGRPLTMAALESAAAFLHCLIRRVWR